MATDYVDDDFIFDTQWLAMKRAIQGNGILSGMAVTPNGTQPPIEVDIASGVFYANLTRSVYAGGSQALDAAHATFDRWDLLSGVPGGTILYTAGAAAATPKPPDLPAGHIIIALVYVPATTTVILASHIRDFGFWTSLFEHGSRHLPDATNDSLPVGTPSDIGTSNAEGSANAFVRQDHVHKHPSGLGTDLHHGKQHGLGSGPDHSSATIAQLNALVTDANMDDSGSTRTPSTHDHTKHTDRTRRAPINIFGMEVLDVDSKPALASISLPGPTTYRGFKFPDAVVGDYLWIFINTPIGFVSHGDIHLILAATASGNVRIDITTQRILDAISSQDIDSSTLAIPANVPDDITFTATWGWVSTDAGILLGIRRQGTDGADTLTTDLFLLGAYIEYTADQ
jgi:hypothetical protein